MMARDMEKMQNRQKAGLTSKEIYEMNDGYAKWLVDNESKLTDPQLLRFVRYAKDRKQWGR